MSERTFDSFEKATVFASLVKTLSGRPAKAVQQGAHWVVRPDFGSRSIVEVTEELLRQVGK